MKKTLLVLRNEIITAVTRKSFLFTAFGMPLIAVLIFLGASVLRSDALGSLGGGGATGASDKPKLQVEGYVDHSGLIEAIHESVPEGILVAYPNEGSARQALNDGEIAAYYVIPTDYVVSGDLIYMRSQAFDLEGRRVQTVDPTLKPLDRATDQLGRGTHLFSPTGFLDDQAWHRSYWVFGRAFSSGCNWWYRSGRYAPAGRMLVFEDGRHHIILTGRELAGIKRDPHGVKRRITRIGVLDDAYVRITGPHWDIAE